MERILDIFKLRGITYNYLVNRAKNRIKGYL